MTFRNDDTQGSKYYNADAQCRGKIQGEKTLMAENKTELKNFEKSG